MTIEFFVHADDIPIYLNGCGMIIVNPPWQFKEKIEPVLAWLWQVLNIKQQGFFLHNLTKNYFFKDRAAADNSCEKTSLSLAATSSCPMISAHSIGVKKQLLI